MKYTTIKAGYRLTAITWENDGDNYNTKTTEGMSKDDVQCTVDLLKLFHRNAKGSNDFSNMYSPRKAEIRRLAAAIRDVAIKHEAFVKEHVEFLLDEIDGAEDEYPEYMDGVNDLLWELGVSSGEFYTRVVESIKVEYIPEDIQIQDVTAEFV